MNFKSLIFSIFLFFVSYLFAGEVGVSVDDGLSVWFSLTSFFFGLCGTVYLFLGAEVEEL